MWQCITKAQTELITNTFISKNCRVDSKTFLRDCSNTAYVHAPLSRLWDKGRSPLCLVLNGLIHQQCILITVVSIYPTPHNSTLVSYNYGEFTSCRLFNCWLPRSHIFSTFVKNYSYYSRFNSWLRRVGGGSLLFHSYINPLCATYQCQAAAEK